MVKIKLNKECPIMSDGKPTCYFQKTDPIKSLELCNPHTNYIGEFYLMCDKKHVLKYYRNPDGTNTPDNISITLVDLRKNYTEFFSSNIPDDVMEHYNYALYFITTEYWSGAAYSVRTLLERLIYDNYGPYFFSKKPYLSFRTDKKELEKIYSTIGEIGFHLFLNTILSESIREKIKNINNKKKQPVSSYDKKIKNNLNALMIIIKKIEDNPTNNIFLDKNRYKEFQEQYNDLSKGLHPRTPIGNTEISKALNVVLAGYHSYFKKGNTWRVKYD